MDKLDINGEDVQVVEGCDCDVCDRRNVIAVCTRSYDPFIFVCLCRDCLLAQVSLLD